MLETLKKKSQRSRITRAIVCTVIAVILLAFTKFALFDVITGPAELDITAAPETYKGKYVTIDAEFFLTDYVEHTTTTTRRYGGSSTRVDGNSYIVFQSVDDYEKNSSVWYYYSVYMPKSKQNSLYVKIDDTWEYWQDESGTVAPPEPVRVTGTWSPMEAEMERYYRETLAEMGVTESEFDQIYFYTLDTAKLGGQNIYAFWVCSIAAILLVLYVIYDIVMMCGNSYAAEINKYLQNNASVSMSAIEADFGNAHTIGKDVWVGKNWTIFVSGPKCSILPNKDLVWGYYFRRTGRNSASEMRLYTKEKKLYHISLSESQTKEALQYYIAEQPHMVIGYTSDLEKTYQKKFQEFLELRYNPAMREAEANSWYGDYRQEETSTQGQETPRDGL